MHELQKKFETKFLNYTFRTLNFKKKQEKLSQQNQSFDLELQYNLPKVLSKLINKLELANLKNDDVSFVH
jgi:hypothetical protein